ncbi:HTH-like domain-containing protein [Peptoclostridium litorale DSM 5388]|uniref:Integrase, catalytic region n=1 Tax=Peptoclostridium litorale DSM 5388 TaxID=1121324 RepID=A0A069RDC7_PEPLI|nr:IS3 family transposase [Peptoclostridium litorale]KDR95064.1 integrase, catalytic region [Peptoclostridium litorale DSM 5388]SIN75604.1 HTH-like domain-containing protein [Peptoclostridium litorale DSM 5388]
MALKKTNSNLANEEKKTLIERNNSNLTIKRQCELLDLSRSTAYYQNIEIKPSCDEIAIKNAIDIIHYKEPSYGVRRIINELRKVGFANVGKRLVRRYMQEMCIVAFYPGPNLSKCDKKAKTYPYLLRNLNINRPNQVWAIDITYIGTPTGFVYGDIIKTT